MNNLERILSHHIEGGPGAWKALYDDIVKYNSILERVRTEKKELALLVHEMRECQKKFFRTKDHYWITKSKSLEKEVDEKIYEILDPKPQQQSLFK